MIGCGSLCSYLCTAEWRYECQLVRSGRNSIREESGACTRWIDPAEEIGYVLRPLKWSSSNKNSINIPALEIVPRPVWCSNDSPGDRKVAREDKDRPEEAAVLSAFPVDGDVDDPLAIWIFWHCVGRPSLLRIIDPGGIFRVIQEYPWFTFQHNIPSTPTKPETTTTTTTFFG